jgi:proteasome lid subunit RPN8/RPN11
VDAPQLVALPDAVRASLFESARRAYPREACGFLIGRRDAQRVDVVAVRDARNLDPELARFRADPVDHLAAEERAAELGLAVVGTWHSHPDRPARPSESDRVAAGSGWTCVIVSVARGDVAELRAWRLAGEAFEEQRLVS